MRPRAWKRPEDLNFALLEDYAVRECPACVNTEAHKKSQLEPQKLAKESPFYRIQESEVRSQKPGFRIQGQA